MGSLSCDLKNIMQNHLWPKLNFHGTFYVMFVSSKHVFERRTKLKCFPLRQGLLNH